MISLIYCVPVVYTYNTSNTVEKPGETHTNTLENDSRVGNSDFLLYYTARRGGSGILIILIY